MAKKRGKSVKKFEKMPLIYGTSGRESAWTRKRRKIFSKTVFFVQKMFYRLFRGRWVQKSHLSGCKLTCRNSCFFEFWSFSFQIVRKILKLWIFSIKVEQNINSGLPNSFKCDFQRPRNSLQNSFCAKTHLLRKFSYQKK